MTNTAAALIGTYHYSGSNIVHIGIADGNDNIWPACGTKIGRYALPWKTDREVTCKKCQKL